MLGNIDWKVVDARVRAVIAAHTSLLPSKAFVMVSLEALFGLNATEINDSITDGGNDFGIDAIIVDEEGLPRVHLLNCKYREKEENAARRAFPSTEAAKILNFLTLMLRGSDGDASRMNPELAEKVQQLRDMMDRGMPVDFVVHLCSNGARLGSNERAIFQEQLRPYKYVSLTVSELANQGRVENRPSRHAPFDACTWN